MHDERAEDGGETDGPGQRAGADSVTGPPWARPRIASTESDTGLTAATGYAQPGRSPSGTIPIDSNDK